MLVPRSLYLLLFLPFLPPSPRTTAFAFWIPPTPHPFTVDNSGTPSAEKYPPSPPPRDGEIERGTKWLAGDRDESLVIIFLIAGFLEGEGWGLVGFFGLEKEGDSRRAPAGGLAGVPVHGAASEQREPSDCLDRTNGMK